MSARLHQLGNWAVELRHDGTQMLLVGTVEPHPVDPSHLQQCVNELSDMMASTADDGMLSVLGCEWHRSTSFASNWNLVWPQDRISLPQALVYAIIGDAQALALGADWGVLPPPLLSNGNRRVRLGYRAPVG